MLAMDEAQRQKFDYIREPEPAEADDDWQDEPYNAMDIDSILKGTAVVDLSHEGGYYPVKVLDTYASSRRKVALREGDFSVPAAFVCEGIIPCAPHLATLAITVHVLELYRNASLRCPHLAINSFVKALCDLHGVLFRPYLRKQFSICFDVYLAILLCVDQRIQIAIKRDDPGWRLHHACPACTYKLTGEPKLLFSILVTMDGNDSLKHIQHRKPAPLDPGDGAPVIGQPNERKDERTVAPGYYIT
ncbi:hypothetical protein K443DRAFT_124935 [Laccaria amethystina LaAM-08-1]|uniref:CxC2-like cysteine cluster KDZ transposase-associated domain-containing protein n=1 Tax=Laccaria amethystina LaAM-08-1 TaxID=1095629 RepID=A0A0C9WJS7_9AGAR|nr:hypothetical protein K443DRAFT_124935 [Laccaria amethystina LaAM-08-1]